MGKIKNWRQIISKHRSGRLQHYVWQMGDGVEAEVVAVEEPPRNWGDDDHTYQLMVYQDSSDISHTADVYNTENTPDKGEYYRIGYFSNKEEARKKAVEFMENHPHGFMSLEASKHAEDYNGWYSTEKDYSGFHTETVFIHKRTNKTISISKDGNYKLRVPSVEGDFSGIHENYDSLENALREARAIMLANPDGIAPSSTGDGLEFSSGTDTEESERRREILKEAQ